MIFIPQGEFVAFGALTLALLQNRQVPGTGLAAADAGGPGGLAGARERPARRPWPPAVLKSMAIVLATARHQRRHLRRRAHGPPLVVQALLAIALVVPLGSLVYRLAYESIADASVLVLLIVSVGVHFILAGLGLIFFGAEGFRPRRSGTNASTSAPRCSAARPSSYAGHRRADGP